MNRFKSEIVSLQGRIEDRAKSIREVSEKLRAAMSLAPQDLEYAHREKTVWDVGSFIIHVKRVDRSRSGLRLIVFKSKPVIKQVDFDRVEPPSESDLILVLEEIRKYGEDAVC